MTKQVVAAAQLGPCSEPRYDTVARIVALIEQAANEGVTLAVFPELALSPYFAIELIDDTSPFGEPALPSAATEPIFEAVRRTGIEVTLPFAEPEGSCLYNSVALLGPGGEVGRFRKMHIPGKFEPDPDKPRTNMEKRYFTPGNLGFPVFDAAAGKVGMLICADRRYPESYRCLGLNGAEIIAIGYNTGTGASGGARDPIAGGQELSELAMRSGAYANNVHVIGAGKAGVEWGAPYIGGSVVIGTNGEILAKATTDGDELVIAEIDLAKAEEARAQRNLTLNRRPDAYGAIAATPVLV